jgi:hypothetical protein
MSIKEGSWYEGRYYLQEYDSSKLVDTLGRPLNVGDRVLRAVTFGRSAGFEFTTIREIKKGRIYLASSKVPINFPSRLLIVNDLFPNGYPSNEND